MIEWVMRMMVMMTRMAMCIFGAGDVASGGGCCGGGARPGGVVQSRHTDAFGYVRIQQSPMGTNRLGMTHHTDVGVNKVGR